MRQIRIFSGKEHARGHSTALVERIAGVASTACDEITLLQNPKSRVRSRKDAHKKDPPIEAARWDPQTSLPSSVLPSRISTTAPRKPTRTRKPRRKLKLSAWRSRVVIKAPSMVDTIWYTVYGVEYMVYNR